MSNLDLSLLPKQRRAPHQEKDKAVNSINHLLPDFKIFNHDNKYISHSTSSVL